MAVKKSKKSQGDNIVSKLQLVIKSGKASLGYNSTLKAVRDGSAKLVVFANNTPALRKSELEYYGVLSQTRVYQFPGDNNALGTALGKHFRIGALAITNAGDSDILQME